MADRHFRALADSLRTRLTQAVLRHRIAARHPGLRTHPSVIWDYAYRDLDQIEIGDRVTVCAFSEIIVYRRSPRSQIEGKLILRDGAIISTGCNIRAAGGRIEVGRNSAIAQNTVLVAANHALDDEARSIGNWDETRTGVVIGENVWVGANSVLLPGTRIGKGSIIAAGAAVTGEVPSGEVWGGVPARRIKLLPDRLGESPGNTP